jgi:hypothetical protein
MKTLRGRVSQRGGKGRREAFDPGALSPDIEQGCQQRKSLSLGKTVRRERLLELQELGLERLPQVLEFPL